MVKLFRRVLPTREGWPGTAGCVIASLMLFALNLAGQELFEPSSSGQSLKPSYSLMQLAPEKQSAIQTALRAHNYTAAEELLALESKRNPKSQPLLLFLAGVLFLDGKQLNTAMVLKKAELLGPLDEHSRFLLALSYISLGRKSLAIPELQKLAESNRANAVYPYWLSKLAYRKMNLDEALSYARQAVELNPKLPKAFDQLGLCYAGIGKDEDAILAYREAIRLNREQSLRWPWPSMNLGTLYLRLGRLDEAEASLRESLALEPQFPISHFRLGQVLEKKGLRAAAAEQLNEAARLDPTYPEPHYALARIYKGENDLKAAAHEISLFKSLREQDKQKGITRPD